MHRLAKTNSKRIFDPSLSVKLTDLMNLRQKFKKPEDTTREPSQKARLRSFASAEEIKVYPLLLMMKFAMITLRKWSLYR
jgi:hypothetical protein